MDTFTVYAVRLAHMVKKKKQQKINPKVTPIRKPILLKMLVVIGTNHRTTCRGHSAITQKFSKLCSEIGTYGSMQRGVAENRE